MKFTIDHFDGDRAVLRTDDGRELAVPTAELPTGVTVGDALTVQFGAAGAAARTQAAKDVLNEILGEKE